MQHCPRAVSGPRAVSRLTQLPHASHEGHIALACTSCLMHNNSGMLNVKAWLGNQCAGHAALSLGCVRRSRTGHMHHWLPCACQVSGEQCRGLAWSLTEGVCWQIGFIDDRYGPQGLALVVVLALLAIFVVSIVDFAMDIVHSP